MHLANLFGLANPYGQQPKQSSSEPSGIIPIPLEENARAEVRFWENPVKDSSEIRVGYSKQRVVMTKAGEKHYRSFQLRQAVVDVMSTYLLCKNVLERHGREIFLVEEDLRAATQVVTALQGLFQAPPVAPRHTTPTYPVLPAVPSQAQTVVQNGNGLPEHTAYPNLLIDS